MINRVLGGAVIGLLCSLLISGCGTTPEASPATPASSPSVADFRQPGVAADMVNQLLTKAESDRLLSVEISATTVEVTVLDEEDATHAWAYRQGELAEVPTDQQYVDQATFDIASFNLTDIGALFRAAAGQSGSAESQTLTIVDYSGGNVTMSISTVPESRTVFFTPDGSLLPILSFDTPGGISSALEEVLADHQSAYSVTVDSESGVWAEYPGETDTLIRLTRTAKVPVTTNVTARSVDLPQFPVEQVDPEAIWEVIDRLHSNGDLDATGAWSVVIDDREEVGHPRMYFRAGSNVIVTDLAGNRLVS